MVTAILPSLTDESDSSFGSPPNSRKSSHNPRDSVALSVESQLTITPERFARSQSNLDISSNATAEGGGSSGTGKPAALAGYVGVFTGCGALVALVLFLPLPAQFGKIEDVTMAEAVSDSFYVVGAVSVLVAAFVYVGLKGLKGEEGKGWRMLLGSGKRTQRATLASDEEATSSDAEHEAATPYWRLLRESVALGFTDSQIALGYLGGFVARASTVAISLFIPLFVNSFFIRNGYCQGSPNDPSPDLKKECRAAYVLASMLTGVAQLMGLICAPLFGYLSGRPRRVNYPILVATTFGIAGYIAFPRLSSPEPKDVDGRGGTPAVFLIAALIGISQIGAIVCSLGSLGKGVLAVDPSPESRATAAPESAGEPDERAPLIEALPVLDAGPARSVSRVRLKGSIAGVYSWCGGAAILLLTKLGGYLFDTWTTAAPFYMMAIFNAVLLFASLGIDAGRVYQKTTAQR